MSRTQKELSVAAHTTDLNPMLLAEVRESIVVIRDMPVIADADVANLYGVETKRVNEAVRNNPDKFPEDYMFVLSAEESDALRSKISATKISSKSRTLPKVFTEKGLYMLATILKSKSALNVTFSIIETFAQVRSLKRELVDLHKETDPERQTTKMEGGQKFFCSPSYGPPNPRRLTSATPIRGTSHLRCGPCGTF